MVMSTQTSAKAALLLQDNVLQDTIKVYQTGAPVTVGFNVTRGLTLLHEDVPALVQTTVLQNAAESVSEHVYSIKVAQKFPLEPGHIVQVEVCRLEPALEGKRLLVDKVSLNGAALLRKGVARDFAVVNQQGKASA